MTSIVYFGKLAIIQTEAIPLSLRFHRDLCNIKIKDLLLLLQLLLNVSVTETCY